jgi:hypothetical protein
VIELAKRSIHFILGSPAAYEIKAYEKCNVMPNAKISSISIHIYIERETSYLQSLVLFLSAHSLYIQSLLGIPFLDAVLLCV